MSVLDRAVEKNANLSYVASKVIECFQDAGLDLNYIDDKICEFSDLSNYAALHKALRTLDDKNMVRLAAKLEVSFNDLETTLSVLNKI
ncbi:hypothetical protein [Acinetobacter seifertii]|uniref:hypothetical protein n=1 Tax=Acinetobacter seifertii TaxID=1530123 RepID=UPI000C21E7CD|nr:hypothetical protein [Acinetobacter seifertii]PJG65688.1 hypothetical protein CVD09_15075 [Acinetobacter seifertii]